MKKNNFLKLKSFLFLAVMLGSFSQISIAKAAEILMPFGGKIVAITAGVICQDGNAPFFIKPVLPLFPAGPYGGTSASRLKFPKAKIVPGAWVIGLYSQTPAPLCYTVTPVGPAPVPGIFPVIIIGTSL